MKSIFVLFFIITISFSTLPAQIISIAEAIEDLNSDYYPDKLGDTVTVQGIIFSPNFGSYYTNYYIDDGTAATRIFQSNLLTFDLGDEVQITGVVTQFFGVNNIEGLDSTGISLQSTGNPLPDPITLTLAQYLTDPEAYEGSLIAFSSLTMVGGTWPLPGNTVSVQISDGIDTLNMVIDKDTDIDENPEPSWPKDIIGIGDQYTNNTPPDDGYSLRPRYYSDFMPAGTLSVETHSLIESLHILGQNYPNPFNHTTTIEVNLQKKEHVIIEILNQSGKKIETLVDIIMPSGLHKVEFATKNLSSGVYYYRIRTGKFQHVKKMLLVR